MKGGTPFGLLYVFLLLLRPRNGSLSGLFARSFVVMIGRSMDSAFALRIRIAVTKNIWYQDLDIGANLYFVVVPIGGIKRPVAEAIGGPTQRSSQDERTRRAT